MKVAENILVIDLGGIGDLVLSIPFLRGLKTSFPSSKVSLLCPDRTGGILKDQPYIDTLYRSPIEALGIMQMALKLRRMRFDLSVNLMPKASLSAGIKIYILFHLINAKLWAGRNTEGRGFFYDIKIEEEKMQMQNEVLILGRLLRAIGGNTFEETLEYHISEEQFVKAENLLREETISSLNPLVAVNPGSDWSSRRWPIHRYADLLKRLKLRFSSIGFLVIGTGKEIMLAEQLRKEVGESVYILSGKTSSETIPAILKYSDILITNDSGPSHVARAIGIPAVTLTGPGHPAYSKVKGKSEHVVIRHGVSCSPCVKKVCNDMRCWESINVEEVFEEVSSLIRRKVRVEPVS